MTQNIKTGLPIPNFFDPSRVGDLFRVPFDERLLEAVAYRDQHGISPAATDKKCVIAAFIDVQLTFCSPDAALFVGGRSGTGAVDDTRRTCEFLYRNLDVITEVNATMDTHTAFQIFHPSFWVDKDGKHPAPYTMITVEDVESGAWSVNPGVAFAVLNAPAKLSYMQSYALHYVKRLRELGKYDLTIWPFHGMIGDIDHALVPSLTEAVFFHNAVRNSQFHPRIKGGNPLTENYSVLRPEVLEDQTGRTIAQKNTPFLEDLLRADYLIIAGQAKSHCVAWAIDDLLTEILAKDPELAKKVYLVEDLTSPVVVPGVIDYTDDANAAFARFAQAGMHVVQSTVPVADWPGIELS